MSEDSMSGLEAAVRALRTRLQRGKAPTRFDARAVLIALGELVAAEHEEAARGSKSVREALARHAEAWQAAVNDEMALACAEHVRGVDPRYLDNPRYDFEYTVEARRRLELRLMAVDALELEVDEALLGRLEAADAILEPYLRRRRGEPPAN